MHWSKDAYCPRPGTGANGTRTRKTLNGTTQTYSVDDGYKLTAITQGATTLAYDVEGRVTSISGPGGSNAFSYNGLDTRVGKVDSAGTSTYRRDGADVTAPVLGDGAAVYTPGVSQRRGGATTFDLHDQPGTAVKQTSASASVTATRTYDAFGMLVSSTGTPQGPFGFAAASGYQEDGDSGLKLLGHRYYDPSTGRFLTRDPVKDGRNWYAYCEGNPLRTTDSAGLKPGDKYPTPDAAGKDAIRDINGKSADQNQEYGGEIYRNPDGSYSYTKPVGGGIDAVDPHKSPHPPGTTPVGTYHTHGGQDPKYDSEHFSPDDKRLDGEEGGTHYLGTPNGVIYKHDTDEMTIVPIGRAPKTAKP